MVFSSVIRLLAIKPKKSAATRLTPAKHVVSTVHGTRTVLLNGRNGHYWGLDEVGSRIWLLLLEGCSPNDIAEKLAAEYDAPVASLQQDVDRFLAQLREANLVKVV